MSGAICFWIERDHTACFCSILTIEKEQVHGLRMGGKDAEIDALFSRRSA
jgi:hypothetical protein